MSEAHMVGAQPKIMVVVCPDNHLHVQDPEENVLAVVVIYREQMRDSGEIEAQCLTAVSDLLSPEQAAFALEDAAEKLRAMAAG